MKLATNQQSSAKKEDENFKIIEKGIYTKSLMLP